MGFGQRSTARRLGFQAALSVSGARFGTTWLRGKVPSLPTALDPAQRCLVGGKPVAPNSAYRHGKYLFSAILTKM